jgi:hypothetical protein
MTSLLGFSNAMRNVLGFALFLLGCSSALGQAHPPRINGKPVFHQEVMPLVEKSLAAMWDFAHAVVEVQIESSEVKGVGRGPIVTTSHMSRVLRTFKGDMKAGTTIVFTELAGRLELPDRILIGATEEPIASGDRYIVFLVRSTIPGEWALSGQHEGAFKLHKGHIQPQGTDVVAQEQRDVTERQFSDELGRLARRDRPKA